MGKSAMGWALLAALALAGCSKVTAENFGKVKTGMDYGQVRDLLGDPSSCSEELGLKGCSWESGEGSARVNFVADKAVAFSSSGLR